MDWEYSEVFRLEEAAVAGDGRAFVAAAWAFMEETAVTHAGIMGLGLDKLRSNGLAWVLVRLRLEATSLPRKPVNLRVTTWPVSVDRLQFRRDFLARNEDGREYIRGMTHWVVMDLSTRKVIKVPEFIAGCAPPAGTPRAFEEDRVRPAGAANSPILGELLVTPEDIDLNRHVNNVRYINWMLGSMPGPASLRLAALRVLFRSEAFCGDQVLVRCGPGEAPGEFAHGLYRRQGSVPGSEAQDGLEEQELVRGLTLWT
ncbi:MAG: thioesterase [Desulfovibrionaceae bacterium]|nr:thioesterase [Desulfovibrionaceae bacterium]